TLREHAHLAGSLDIERRKRSLPRVVHNERRIDEEKRYQHAGQHRERLPAGQARDQRARLASYLAIAAGRRFAKAQERYSETAEVHCHVLPPLLFAGASGAYREKIRVPYELLQIQFLPSRAVGFHKGRTRPWFGFLVHRLQLSGVPQPQGSMNEDSGLE